MAEKRIFPKTFFSSMGRLSLDEFIAMYDDLQLTAYMPGDRDKRTPLFWGTTPNNFIEWLVAQGLDVNEPDGSGITPLGAQARSAAIYPETLHSIRGKCAYYFHSAQTRTNDLRRQVAAKPHHSILLP